VYEAAAVVPPLLEVVDPAVEVLVGLLLVVLLGELVGVVQALFEGAEAPELLNDLTT
jgi:hypothetical protein